MEADLSGQPSLALDEPVQQATEADDSKEQQPFTVWENDVFEEGRLEASLRRLESSGPALPLFWRFAHGSRSTVAWDKFYKAHADRFFKERHYLERDFPALLAARERPFDLLEVGCGTGASFYPLLPRLPQLTVTAVDLSARAIANIHANPQYSCGRVCAFVHDAADGDLASAVRKQHAAWVDPRVPRAPDQVPPLASEGPATSRNRLTAVSLQASRPAHAKGFDAVLLLFMLSAMPPEAHLPIIRDAAACLRPGGLLLFRDYGWLDEAQLRFGKGSKLDAQGRLCVRGDGTLAYYFEPIELAAHAAAAGLEVDWSRVSAGHPGTRPVDTGAGQATPSSAALPQPSAPVLDAERCVEDGSPSCLYLYRKYRNRAEGTELRRVFVHGVFTKPRPSVI